MSRSHELDPALAAMVGAATGGGVVTDVEVVQRLWSDYGQIVRCRLQESERTSVILKHVRWPDAHDHPRGWSTDRSHERKVRSYRVETTWYETYAARCREASPVPACFAHENRRDGVVIVLEDLDASGFAGRRHRVNDVEVDACLRWLAHFHATFLDEVPAGLWPVGTYWHLETRPDELAVLTAGPLKTAAPVLDQRLSGARFATFVHGDAKLANFCFSSDGARAAAVDFQYVGGGCGMKDVAYFLSSCFDDDECERRAPVLLDRYFEFLRVALDERKPELDAGALEAEWRELYPLAWADFARFLQGWSPGHWKLHGYTDRITDEALHALGFGTP